MAHVLGIGRSDLLISRLDEEAPADFELLLARREVAEPVAYILRRRAFWTIELQVGPGVLVPRPDSETLIEAAVEQFGDAEPARILDLGTGPGTLLLAALDQWRGAEGVGIDLSETALRYARRNAKHLGLSARASFQHGNWAEGLDEPFDLILCNPPYVESGAELPREVAGFEPSSALFAGVDGLDDYRRLAPEIPRLLKPGGVACVEIGAGQAEAVRDLFIPQGLKVRSRNDLAGHVRCLILCR